MSNTTEHPSIDAYLAQAHSLWTKHDVLPNDDELRAIAESVSMTPEASEVADERAHELTRQAQQAIDDKDINTAESLLRDAVLLSPVRVQPHYLLARIYAERHGDNGDNEDRRRALELTDQAHKIDPEHGATRSIVEQLGRTPHDGLPWKKAALIVGIIIVISGSLQLCHRVYLTDDVTDEQTEAVREYLQEHGEPPR